MYVVFYLYFQDLNVNYFNKNLAMCFDDTLKEKLNTQVNHLIAFYKKKKMMKKYLTRQIKRQEVIIK